MTPTDRREMGEIQRYDVTMQYDAPEAYPTVYRDNDGPYVLYEDHATALAAARERAERAEAAMSFASMQINQCILDGDLCKMDRQRLAEGRDRITKALTENQKATEPKGAKT